MFVLMLPQKFG